MRIRLSHRVGIFDLFSGAGGFTWGWKEAGFLPQVAIDNDVNAARTHELNFPHSMTLHRDLTQFSPRDLLRALGSRPRELLAIVGGPPCQGWSNVGRGKLRSLDKPGTLLKDPRNRLYKQFLKYAEFFRPPLVVMENVPGMLSLEGRNVAEEVKTHFEAVGYRCSYTKISALAFGVPQDRQRLMFFGVRQDINLPVSPAGLRSFAERFKRDVLRLPSSVTTVRQAIADLPRITHSTQEDPQVYRPRRNSSRYSRLMRARSNGMLTDHVTRYHNLQDLEAFRSLPQGGLYYQLDDHLKRYRDDIFRDKYRKLRWDGPAGTVTAHLAKDCYTHIHPDQARTVSVREAARFQSFPDDFRFFGNMGDKFRQIGNAVPPLMAYGIAAYIREVILLSEKP